MWKFSRFGRTRHGVAVNLDARTIGTVIEPAPAAPADNTAARTRLTRKASKLTAALDNAAEAYVLGDIPSR